MKGQLLFVLTPADEKHLKTCLLSCLVVAFSDEDVCSILYPSLYGGSCVWNM